MLLRTTHTFVLLDVPYEMYNLVREKLIAAGYDHAVDDTEKTLDMHGIALTPEEANGK